MSKRIILGLFIALLAGLVCTPYVAGQIQLTPVPNQADTSAGNNDLFLDRSLKAIRNYISVGDFSRAAALIASLEKTYGDDMRIANEKKRLYRAQKNYPELKAMIEQELQRDPGNFSLLCQLGEVYFQSDSLDKARQIWEDAFAAAGQAEFNYLLLANYYRSYGFYDEAISVYTRARTILNNPRLFSAELSDLYITQRNYLKAVEENLALIQQSDDHASIDNVSRMILTIYDESDNPDLVLNAIERAVKDESTNPQLETILGDIYVKKGQFSEAFESYKEAESLAGGDGYFLVKFAKLCFDNRAYDMAIKAADFYFSRTDGKMSQLTDEISLLKAKSLAELGSYQPAFAVLESVENGSKNQGTRLDAIYVRGEIYAKKLGDYDKAAEAFQMAVNTGRKMPVALKAELRLAEMDISKREFTGAETRLDDVTDNDRSRDKALSEQADYLKTEILFFNGRFDDAANEYKRIALQYPQGFYSNDCLDRLALLTEAAGDSVLNAIAQAAWYRYTQQYDSAIVVLKEATLQSNSKAYEYMLFLLPKYYAESGNWQMAIGAYERYLTSFEEKGVYADKALFNLAELYYKKADRADKADQLFNKLVTEHPSSPLIEKARAYLNILKAS